MATEMRTRFAPSPTGQLHVGGARTAVLNWLLARHSGGSFVLRIEDTDQVRNVEGAEAAILDDLEWLGLDWDEGPVSGGPHGPYRQSDRADQYRDAAEILIQSGAAYYCTCPATTEATGQHRPRCACATRERPVSRPAEASIRFLVNPEGEIVFRDLIRGEIAYPADSVEDFVLVRSDGRPTYNFAAVVDDAAMRITHVVRGSDHLANTPKQLLLFDALGLDAPRYAHIPLILGEDHQKLSKRHGATSVGEHRRLGYHPEALVNYLSLLSWSSPSGEEFLPRERLIEEIDLGRMGASDAIFDRAKLRWLSGEYIRADALDELVARAAPFVDPGLGISPDRLPAALDAVRDRISLFSEVNTHLAPFAGPRTSEQIAARDAVFEDPAAVRVLATIAAALASLDSWDESSINQAIRTSGKEAGVKGRELFHPLRLALTGEERGLELPRILSVIGPERAAALLTRSELEV